MNIEDVTKEHIKKEHIELALAYISQHGKVHNGIKYLYNKATVRGIKYKSEHVAVRAAMRVAALYAAEVVSENEEISKEVAGMVPEEVVKKSWSFLKRRGFDVFKVNQGIAEEVDSDEESDEGDVTDSKVANEALSVLNDLRQIILYGPPGTGKTYLAKTAILPSLLDMDEEDVYEEQGVRWDIVQFHPSYNYEDFVRGIQVETSKDNVVYKTKNRIFGKMCKRAQEDKEQKYVLIIDEINRANVSAVLGELIYALEYRDQRIKTPYAIDSEEGDDEAKFSLVIPKNLYIIGTMNTADRTIGQIDYAVRRRFAFVHCPPKEDVITDSKARSVFAIVNGIFDNNEYMSSDYNADDVRVGHSYFLATSDELVNKIKYQVFPILHEYAKDGVLLKLPEDEIEKIRQILAGDVQLSPDRGDTTGGKYEWVREKDGYGGSERYLGRIPLAIAKDYVKQNSGITLKELQDWFPDRHNLDNHGIKPKEHADRINKKGKTTRFHTKDDDVLQLVDGDACVTTEWSDGHKFSGGAGSFYDFVKEIEKKGYKVIRPSEEAE